METIQENIVKFKFSIENFNKSFVKQNHEICSKNIVNFDFEGNRSVWHLVVYPNGKVKDDSGYLGLFLELIESDAKIIDAHLKLYLINCDGERVYMKESNMHFDKSVGWGWGQFIELSKIFKKKNILVPNNVITLGCEFTFSQTKIVNKEFDNVVDRLLEKLEFEKASADYYQKKYQRVKNANDQKDLQILRESQEKVFVLVKEFQAVQKTLANKEAEVKNLLKIIEDKQNEHSLLSAINEQFKEKAEKSERNYVKLTKKYTKVLEQLQEKDQSLRILEEECPNYYDILKHDKKPSEKGLEKVIDVLKDELNSMKIEMKTLNKKFMEKSYE